MLPSLISPLVHRINNSLAVVKASCDLAAEQGQTPEPDLTNQELVRTNRILTKLSAFTKQRISRRTTMELGAVVDDALVLVEELASERSVDLGWNAPETPTMIHGDRTGLEHFLVTLCAEIVARIPGREAGAPTHLGIELSCDESEASLCIEYSGAAPTPLDDGSGPLARWALAPVDPNGQILFFLRQEQDALRRPKHLPHRTPVELGLVVKRSQ